MQPTMSQPHQPPADAKTAEKTRQEPGAHSTTADTTGHHRDSDRDPQTPQPGEGSGSQPANPASDAPVSELGHS